MKAAILIALAVSGAALAGAEALAQDDPEILLELASRAQAQVAGQVSEGSGDEVKQLLEEGSAYVDMLGEALGSYDLASAQEHFLAAMGAFKAASERLSSESGIPAEPGQRDPESDLARLSAHAENLKRIAAKHQVVVDFGLLDILFGDALQKVGSGDDITEVLVQIKSEITLIKEQLRDQTLEYQSERALEYAQKWLDRIERLIDAASNRGMPDEVIIQLEDARERLASATSPDQIREEIRQVMSLKDEIGLTKYDIIESRIVGADEAALELFEDGTIGGVELADMQDMLDQAREHLGGGEFDEAWELLDSLEAQLGGARDSADQ